MSVICDTSEWAKHGPHEAQTLQPWHQQEGGIAGDPALYEPLPTMWNSSH